MASQRTGTSQKLVGFGCAEADGTSIDARRLAGATALFSLQFSPHFGVDTTFACQPHSELLLFLVVEVERVVAESSVEGHHQSDDHHQEWAGRNDGHVLEVRQGVITAGDQQGQSDGCGKHTPSCSDPLVSNEHALLAHGPHHSGCGVCGGDKERGQQDHGNNGCNGAAR